MPFEEGGGREGTAILVVDDEPIVRQYVTRVLRDASFPVVEAEDGAQAIAALEQHGDTIGLIICDLVMPGMSGLDLARRVAERWPHQRMLFVSGYPRDALVTYGVFHPRISLLAKPFLPSRLLESVEDARSGSSPAIAEQLTP